MLLKKEFDISSVDMVDTKLKILHLEDVYSDALLICQAIKKGNINFEILVVDTRDKFIKTLKESTPDIILADHSLPSFNSIEALAILQNSGFKIPFILITATVSEEFAVEILKKGADDYILKDRLHRLPTAIHNSLEKSRLKKEREIFLIDLVKREKRYHALFENSADGIAILSADGKPLYVSASIKNVLGYSQEEGMKIDLLSIAHPEDVAALVEMMKRAMANPGVPVKGDATRMWHKNKGWRWIEGILTNLLDDPSIKGIVDNFRDVTDGKQTQKIIYDSEEKYRSFFENSIDGILLTEKNGKVLSANQAACDIFKMTEQEIIDAGRAGLVDLHDARLNPLLEQREKTGRASGELTFKHKDSSHFPGEISSSVFINASGIENTSMVIRDISERTIANEKLKQSELFNKGILASLSSHIAVIDRKGKIIAVNKAWDDFANANGVTSLERVSRGSNYMEVCQRSMALGDHIAAQTLQGILSVFNKEVKSFELEYPCHSPAEQRWFTVSVSPFGEDDTKVVISHQNITDRKKAENKVTFTSSELQKTLIDLNKILDSSLDVICTINADGQFLNVSIASQKVWGYTPEELIGSKFMHLVYKEDVDITNQATEKIIKGIAVPIFENRYVHKSGRMVPILWSVNWDEKLKVMFCVAKDVTKMKEAEQTLRESELNLQAIFNNTSEAFVLTNKFGTIKSFNNKAEETVRLNTQQEITVGNNIYDFIHPSRKDNFRNKIEKVLGGEVMRYDHSHIRKNGEVKWFEFTMNPVFAAGVVEGLCITAGDITERKQIENSLKQSEFQYRQIVETAQEGIWMIDENSKTTFVNQKMCDIIGYSSDEMMGKTIFNFKNEAGLKVALHNLERRKQGITETYTSSFITKDGRLIWTQICANPIFDEAKEYKGSLLMVSDITEKKIADEANRFKANLLNTIGQAAIATDLDGVVNYWNKAAENIYGWTSEETIGKNIILLTPAHIVREQALKIMEDLKNGRTWSGEFRVQRKDGTDFPAMVSNSPIYDENDRLTGIIGISSDITEKKKLEDLLDIANHLAQIGNYEIDLQKKTVYWSDITRQIHEAESNFIPDIEAAINFYKVGTSRNLIVNAVKDAIAHNTPFNLELQIVTAKGNEKWVKVIGETICINGKCIRLYGSFQDIDKVKNAEIKIRESEFRYRQIVETAQEGIWLIDEQNKTTFVNNKMCEILGYEVEEMMGKEIYHFMDATGRAIALDLMQKKRQGETGHDKLRYISKSGNEVWTKISANPLFNEDDSYKGALAMVTDITLEMQHEREIQKNTEEREHLIGELTKSLKDLKEFSYITSHNFKGPFSNLIGLLSILDDSTLSESNREIVKMFKASTEQLNKTINDLIRVLIIRDNVNVNITENNISIILNQVSNSLAYTFEEANCTITTNLAVEVIAFNQLYLESILMNLLSNAIKYRSTERQLHINISTSLEASGKVVLMVSDNGVGIDLNMHGDKIFGLYQRFHSAADGAGLGLFIVKSQITALGGSIQVESEVGKGTSFIITFKDKM